MLEYKLQSIYYGKVVIQRQLSQTCFRQLVYSNMKHDHVAYLPRGSTASHLSSTPDPGQKNVWGFCKIRARSKMTAKKHVVKRECRPRDDTKPDPVATAEGMLINSEDSAWIDFTEHELVTKRCFELSDSFVLTTMRRWWRRFVKPFVLIGINAPVVDHKVKRSDAVGREDNFIVAVGSSLVPVTYELH